jgi:DNA modification methylase
MRPHYEDDWLTVYHGDARAVMAEMEPESVHCVVTSPPYWGLRDYGEPGQLGLEPTPEAYVESMVAVFREVRRVLRSDGTVWLNLGDSYAVKPNNNSYHGKGANTSGLSNPERQQAVTVGSKYNEIPFGLKPKDLVGIPWRVALAIQADGWYLRSDIIWSKPNPMPESVTDRPTKSHEYLFLLSKSPRYYFDADAVREADAGTDHDHRNVLDGQPSLEPSGGIAGAHGGLRTVAGRNGSGRNIRSVWTVATQPYPGAHFATFPPKLIEPCIKAGCPELGTVLDPFAGSGTTGMVAQSLSRRAVLIDLSMDYLGQLMDRNRDIPLGLGA